MAALPGLLAGCGMAATPAGVQQGITDNPLGTDLTLRQVASSAGVPLGERTKGRRVTCFDSEGNIGSCQT